jgi:hypothetical protein
MDSIFDDANWCALLRRRGVKIQRFCFGHITWGLAEDFREREQSGWTLLRLTLCDDEVLRMQSSYEQRSEYENRRRSQNHVS